VKKSEEAMGKRGVTVSSRRKEKAERHGEKNQARGEGGKKAKSSQKELT